MTQIINTEISKYGLAELLAMVRSGDEVIVQEGDTSALHIVQPVVPPPKKPFLFGLSQTRYKNADAGFWMSDNFDDELPMSFWLGEET